MSTRNSFPAFVVLSAFTLVAFAAIPAARAQTVKADYQFQNVFSSSVPGAPDLTPVGGGTAAFVTDTVDTQSRTVYDYEPPSGLKATTTGLIPPNNYSIVVLAAFEFDPPYSLPAS